MKSTLQNLSRRHILGFTGVPLLFLLSGCSKHDTGAASRDTQGNPPSAAANRANAPSGSALASSNTDAASSANPTADVHTPTSSYVPIHSGNQIMFLYYAISDEKPDYTNIAGAYSQNYRTTTDAFKKQDILNALKPKVDAEIADARSHRYVSVDQNSALIGHYNFAKKSFPLNSSVVNLFGSTVHLADNSTISFSDNDQYDLILTNGSQFADMPVADETTAKQIESAVSQGKMFTVRIYAFAKSTDPNRDGVLCEITRVQLLDASGTLLAEHVG
jgi:hypothetical protein